MPSLAKKSGLALAFVAVALATGCAPKESAAVTPAGATVEAKPAPCMVIDKNTEGSYHINRIIDFDTDVVVYKVGASEAGVTATPFTQLTTKAQQKLETLRKTLPAYCQ